MPQGPRARSRRRPAAAWRTSWTAWPPARVWLDRQQGRPPRTSGEAYIIAAPPAIRRSALPRLASQCQAQHDLERHYADREKRKHGLEPDRHLRRRPCPGAEDDEPDCCRQAGAEHEGQGRFLENGLVHRLTSLRVVAWEEEAWSAQIGRLAALPPPTAAHRGQAMS